MAQVDVRIRKRGESLPELAQDVKRLIRLAHPSATALNNHDLEWAIVQSTTESIDEALHLALKYKAYNMSKRKPSLRYQSLDDKDQANNRTFKKESRSCFYCQKVGYLAKECNKRKRNLQNTMDQSRMRKNTDFKPRDVTLLLIMASCLVIGTRETARS
jgi:phosphopantetheine adenylyltransferase